MTSSFRGAREKNLNTSKTRCQTRFKDVQANALAVITITSIEYGIKQELKTTHGD